MDLETAVSSGNVELDGQIKKWLRWDKNEKTLNEVVRLVKASQWDSLSKVMLSRLEFGTAGLRGVMKAGFCCMNQLVVLQSAQGLCEYLKKVCTPEQLRAGLIVGYDGRYNSRKFAELTAKVFISSNIPVCLFDEVCPTPWVSFSTKLYGAAAGVMVTASHNPKQDNGYKVYWGNGAQIIRPHDKNIEASIRENLTVTPEHWDTDNIRSHPLVTDKLEEVTQEYLARLSPTISSQQHSDIEKTCLEFTYSAMHGVGYPYVEKAFAHVGLKPLVVVPEQQHPDPEFPTVTFPNPEEPSSLQIGKGCAERHGCTILLANDPDADRLAVAEYQTSSKSWHILTGNEAGALLGWWYLRNYLSAHPEVDPSSIVLMASAVSSKMLRAVAKQHGAVFMETLTGFKWMGNKAIQLLSEDKHPIFAFEEAIGFMCGPEVPDKDGVSAAVHFASLSSYLKLQGRGLVEQLDWLYSQYGFHITDNSYYICYDKDIMKKIFKDLRDYKGSTKYPSSLRSWSINTIRDLGVCGEQGAAEGTGLEKKLSSGEMLTLSFDNGLVATIRTSGTEPKVKYYTEMCAQPGQSDREEIKVLLKNMVSSLVEDFLQPKVNGLIERKK